MIETNEREQKILFGRVTDAFRPPAGASSVVSDHKVRYLSAAASAAATRLHMLRTFQNYYIYRLYQNYLAISPAYTQ